MPVSDGIKTANHKLTVIAIGGDGDGYGEGAQHFLHTMRANQDINYFVHDNSIYGLTTGQTSPTSKIDFKTKTTPSGNIEEPINPLALAIANNCTFIAQGFAGDVPGLTKIMKEAIKFKGFSYLNILQPCFTFNKLQTHAWYRERLLNLDDTDHDTKDKSAAFKLVTEGDKLPIGIIYKREAPSYQDKLPQLDDGSLVHQSLKDTQVDKYFDNFR